MTVKSWAVAIFSQQRRLHQIENYIKLLISIWILFYRKMRITMLPFSNSKLLPKQTNHPARRHFILIGGIATLFGSKREEYLLVNTIAIITLTTVMAIAVITITILDLMVLLQQLFPKVPS